MNNHTLSQQQLSRLSFLGESVCYDIGEKELSRGYIITDEVHHKLKNLFCKESEVSTLKPSSKAYIISTQKLALNTVKDTCKQLGFKVTNSIDNADFFIVDKSAFSDYWGTRNYGKISFRLQGSRISDEEEREEQVIFPSGLSNKYGDYRYYGDINIITAEGIDIVYKVLNSKTPLVSADTLFKSIDKVTLDENMYQSIEAMLSSNDLDSQDMGLQILYNCNVEKSGFYLWKLISGDCRYRILYPNKNKNTNLAKDFRSKIHKYDKKPDKILDILASTDLLTEEIYNELVDKMHQEVMDNMNYVSIYNYVNISVEKVCYSDYLRNKLANNVVTEIHNDYE